MPRTKKATEENTQPENYSEKLDMVSISAHQIRTSLSALKWILKMFLDGDLGKLSPEQENLLKKAYDSNDRAIGIVGELLLANKSEETVEEKYNFEKNNITEIIENVVFNFSGEGYNKGIEIIFLKPTNEIPKVDIDGDKIRIVLQNLLENSIKYSDSHGKIFVTLAKKGDDFQVSIKDTGVGISEKGSSKIFEKYFRDEEARKKEIVGSGIGLFTCKKIIESHGGKIWFESKKGEGTTFFFTIPIEGKK